MATQLDTVTLYSDAVNQFTDSILPMFQEGEQLMGYPDTVARSEAWSSFIDVFKQFYQVK